MMNGKRKVEERSLSVFGVCDLAFSIQHVTFCKHDQPLVSNFSHLPHLPACPSFPPDMPLFGLHGPHVSVSSLCLIRKSRRLSAVSEPSTYPANRDFKGHVGGVRGTAPQGFFPIFFEFLLDLQGEKG